MEAWLSFGFLLSDSFPPVSPIISLRALVLGISDRFGGRGTAAHLSPENIIFHAVSPCATTFPTSLFKVL